MSLRVLLLAAFLSSPAHAVSVEAQLEYDCYTEISFFCPKTEPKAWAWLRCLDKAGDAVTARCKNSMEAAKASLTAKSEAPAPQASPAPQAHPSPAAAKAAQPAGLPSKTDARLTRLQGTVYVHLAKQPEDEFVPGEAGMPLDSGDLIRSGTDGKAELAVNAESVIEIGSNTDFQTSELSPEKTQWHLGIGSVVAKIRSLLPDQRMEFVTPTAVAAIRGTELAIAQDSPSEPTRVGVLNEGKVVVASTSGGRAVILTPGQETSVPNGQAPGPAKPLSSLASARKEVSQIQDRINELKKEWKPQNPQVRDQMRQALADQTSIPGAKLQNVGDWQRRMAYPSGPKGPQQQRQSPNRGPDRGGHESGSGMRGGPHDAGGDMHGPGNAPGPGTHGPESGQHGGTQPNFGQGPGGRPGMNAPGGGPNRGGGGRHGR